MTYQEGLRLSSCFIGVCVEMKGFCCVLLLTCDGRRCADTQDEKGRWNNYHDDIDHDGHAIDW